LTESSLFEISAAFQGKVSVQDPKNICQACGAVLKPGEICQGCTVTDLKISDTLVESWARGVPEGPLPVQAYLNDEANQRRIEISLPKVKIGRDPTNQVIIRDDQYTSRFHAWITFEDGHFFVEDLGSTNGTLLNGSPLINRRPLVNGDQVRIGRSEFTFHISNVGLAGRAGQTGRTAQQ
jgi:hypothetical protein